MEGKIIFNSGKQHQRNNGTAQKSAVIIQSFVLFTIVLSRMIFSFSIYRFQDFQQHVASY